MTSFPIKGGCRWSNTLAAGANHLLPRFKLLKRTPLGSKVLGFRVCRPLFAKREVSPPGA